MSLVSYSQEQEKSIWEEFHLDPKFSMGAGVGLITTESSKGYFTSKMFLARYGEDYAGMRFLGVGASFTDKETNFIISPVGIHLFHYVLAIDVLKGASEGAGVSLNYTF